MRSGEMLAAALDYPPLFIIAGLLGKGFKIINCYKSRLAA